MDGERFDGLIRAVTVGSSHRRHALKVLAGGVIGALVTQSVPADDAAAKKKNKPKELRERCNPKKDKCKGNLKCDAPTTRHTCSSSIPKHGDWCCVPPGGKCTECDCCGDYYCEFDNNNEPHCVKNPEN